MREHLVLGPGTIVHLLLVLTLFRSVSGPYPLDISTFCDNQSHLQTLRDVQWGQNCPQLRTMAVEESFLRLRENWKAKVDLLFIMVDVFTYP